MNTGAGDVGGGQDDERRGRGRFVRVLRLRGDDEGRAVRVAAAAMQLVWQCLFVSSSRRHNSAQEMVT
jgi:hypothetical protein